MFISMMVDLAANLHASIHYANISEPQTLLEALACQGTDDVLVLDRVVRPPGWYVSATNRAGCWALDFSNPFHETCDTK